MAGKRKVEVEAKYRVGAPGAADRYLVAPELGQFKSDGPVRSVRVEDRYVDSAVWSLAQAGFAARLRKTSSGVEINLKALSSSEDGLQRRREIEGPADGGLVAAAWPASKARSLVLELCGEAELVELLTIRQLRRVRRMRAADSKAELSVDEVQVLVDGRVLDSFEEMEVELRAGSETALVALAKLLEADADLQPLATSKFERAVGAVRSNLDSLPAPLREHWFSAPTELLAAAGPNPLSPAPEPATVAVVAPAPDPATEENAGATPKSGTRRLGIRAEDTMSEAAVKVLKVNFARLKTREAGTRRGVDPEELHDMRVAARRMGAAWHVFASAFKPGKTKKIRQRLEVITDRLGSARDLDVLSEGLDAYRLALGDGNGASLDPLKSVWRHQRSVARDSLVRELDSGRYETFVKEMGEFLQTGAQSASTLTVPTAPHRVRDRAPSEIWAAYEAVRAYELVLPWADIETLHDLRLTSKKLRYALEFFGEALGPGSDSLLQKVAALQDHLGRLNDADVAARLSRDVLVTQAGQLSKSERDAIGAYLRTREREVARLRRTLGPVWRAVNGAAFRRALGRAIAAL